MEPLRCLLLGLQGSKLINFRSIMALELAELPMLIRSCWKVIAVVVVIVLALKLHNHPIFLFFYNCLTEICM